MKPLIKAVVFGAVRSAMLFLCGWFVRKGWATQDEVNAAIPEVALWILAAVFFVGASVWNKVVAWFTVRAASILPQGASIADIRRLRARLMREHLPNGKAPLALALALALCVCSTSACGKSELEKFKLASLGAAIALDGSPALVTTFLADAEITPEEAERNDERFRSLARLYSAFDGKLQGLEKFDGAAKSDLLGLFRPFVGELRRLNAEKALWVKSERANARFQAVLELLESVSNRLLPMLGEISIEKGLGGEGVTDSGGGGAGGIASLERDVSRLKELLDANGL